MGIIESLPILTELLCISPEVQNDNTFLDALFNKCGHSLQKLSVRITQKHYPRALFKENQILKDLKLNIQTRSEISPDEIIKICRRKSQGFRLTIENYDSPINLITYIQIVKACPHSIINMQIKPTTTGGVPFKKILTQVFNS